MHITNCIIYSLESLVNPSVDSCACTAPWYISILKCLNIVLWMYLFALRIPLLFCLLYLRDRFQVNTTVFFLAIRPQHSDHSDVSLTTRHECSLRKGFLIYICIIQETIWNTFIHYIILKKNIFLQRSQRKFTNTPVLTYVYKSTVPQMYCDIELR